MKTDIYNLSIDYSGRKRNGTVQHLALSRLGSSLSAFRNFDPEMPMQTAMALVYIAQHPGCRISEIGASLGVSSSTASRNVSYLSASRGKGLKGHGLVRARQDDFDRRIRLVELTPRGRKLVDDVIEILSIPPAPEHVHA